MGVYLGTMLNCDHFNEKNLGSVLIRREKSSEIIAVYGADIILRNIVDCFLMLVLCSEIFYDDKLRPVKNF